MGHISFDSSSRKQELHNIGLMEEQFASYDLGVSWTEFGDQDRSDLDRLLDSRPDLTAQHRSKLVSLWKKHPDRQPAGKKESSVCIYRCRFLFISCILSLAYHVSRSSFVCFSKLKDKSFDITTNEETAQGNASDGKVDQCRICRQEAGQHRRGWLRYLVSA